MQIPETPLRLTDLDLMQRLGSYGAGTATFLPDQRALGETVRQACKELHAMLAALERTVAPLLDKVTAKEMDTFTSHDRRHALKVAHIMWHIISSDRRLLLTPPEIGLLVASAFIHDLGMFLSDAERESRLAPESDLWERLEVDPETRAKIEELSKELKGEEVPARQYRLIRRIYQAQEALLCVDNRERHATAERYSAILSELRILHQRDSTNIVDIDATLSFEGDSYLEKLVEICISHNESADALVRRDSSNASRPRFSRDYPVGSSTADLHFIAATLRLADILDFDRERTPPVLFHYFIPGTLNPEDDKSTLEWSKHLAVSNWHIETDEVIFRCRCRNHVVHHGIVQFCHVISEEIADTLATLGSNGSAADLFTLPSSVTADIHEEGYTYVPYRFELDDGRIYKLLMGGSIYNDPLHAIRELVQNAVDACRLRDALTLLNDPASTPSSENRITISYKEPHSANDYPTLEVCDTGTGMDEWVINRWFLKVGRSFYSSTEFNKFRMQLKACGLDFAPTSEFGIGFLSSFLLADRVEIETAMWEPLRGDTKKRTLEIHGPTRLIRLAVDENTGTARFRGTKVVLTLKKQTGKNKLALSWSTIRSYIKSVCVSLPYRLRLQHITASSRDVEFIDPAPLTFSLSTADDTNEIRIPVVDTEVGLKGEIVLLHPGRAKALEREAAEEVAARILDDEVQYAGHHGDGSRLVRAGFLVGPIPGLPRTHVSSRSSRAIVSLDWTTRRERRYALTNLSRTELVEKAQVRSAISRIWMTWLLDHIDELPQGFMDGYDYPSRSIGTDATWIEHFDAFQVYRLAANSWHASLTRWGLKEDAIKEWENSSGPALSMAAPWQNVFHAVLHDLVLPRVCQLHMSEEARLWLSPPAPGWQETLKNCRDYIRKPVTWGSFVRYTGNIENHLYYEYIGSDYLNSKFQARVETLFDQKEIRELIECLRVLADSRKERQIVLSNTRLLLLTKAQQMLGDLEISELSKKWRLDSFQLPRLRDV